MDPLLLVRPARIEDVAQMAQVHVQCWKETYRGLMPDAVLGDPGLPTARELLWTAALSDERYRHNRAAVASRDGQIVGIAMSGPPQDPTAAWTRHLYVLYVQAAHHGTGAGQALLEAVLDPADTTALWVADPTPEPKRSTASTASLPTAQSRSKTEYGRSAWSATCTTARVLGCLVTLSSRGL